MAPAAEHVLECAYLAGHAYVELDDTRPRSSSCGTTSTTPTAATRDCWTTPPSRGAVRTA